MKIESIIKEQGASFDRYLGRTLTLPYSDFESIKIHANDSATAPVINLALEKLHENFLYLYKQSRVASNIIPITQVATAGVSANSDTLRWFDYSDELYSSEFQHVSTTNVYDFDTTESLLIAENINNNNFCIINSPGDVLSVYKTNKGFFDRFFGSDLLLTSILSAREIYPGSNVYWKNIVDFAIGAEYSLYVLDLSAHTIVRYNAEGLLTDNNIYEDELIYLDSTGGYGNHYENNLFNVPRSLDVYNTDVYVLDSGNGCVKKYDKDLNWITTYRLMRDFQEAYPVHLSHDADGNMYVLTDKNLIYRYDNDFQNRFDIPLDSLSANNEIYKKIIFSPTDDAVFYVLSDKNIYKKLVTQPDEDVGKYLPYLLRTDTEDTYKDFFSIEHKGNDFNFVFCQAPNNAGRIVLWLDNINLFDVLSDNNFDVYTIDEIKIHRDEYLQNWVFNKAIAKILINHMRFRDQITGVFVAKRDIKNNIAFQGTRYFLPTELEELRFELNVTGFIGSNEIFQNNIINRCLRNIFNKQELLLRTLTAEILKGFTTEQIVYLE